MPTIPKVRSTKNESDRFKIEREHASTRATIAREQQATTYYDISMIKSCINGVQPTAPEFSNSAMWACMLKHTFPPANGYLALRTPAPYAFLGKAVDVYKVQRYSVEARKNQSQDITMGNDGSHQQQLPTVTMARAKIVSRCCIVVVDVTRPWQIPKESFSRNSLYQLAMGQARMLLCRMQNNIEKRERYRDCRDHVLLTDKVLCVAGLDKYVRFYLFNRETRVCEPLAAFDREIHIGQEHRLVQSLLNYAREAHG